LEGRITGKRKNLSKESETTTAKAVNANTSSTCDRVTAVVDSESANLLASANVNKQLAEEQISVEELQGTIRDKRNPRNYNFACQLEIGAGGMDML